MIDSETKDKIEKAVLNHFEIDKLDNGLAQMIYKISTRTAIVVLEEYEKLNHNDKN